MHVTGWNCRGGGRDVWWVGDSDTVGVGGLDQCRGAHARPHDVNHGRVESRSVGTVVWGTAGGIVGAAWGLDDPQ